MTTTLNLKISFSGGCEILFGTRNKTLTVEQGTKLSQLVLTLKDQILERPDQFVSGNNLRPGILTLVNETDAELLGGEDYQVENNDEISFISTLHGG